MRLLVTGGCGFIGSNFIRQQLQTYDDVSIVNLDLLTYAGNLENLRDVEDNPRYEFVRGDICDRECVNKILESQPVDAVINFAAESHVDRSILDSGPFIQTNIVGTQILLDASRAANVERYVQVSTDEVYGSLGPTGLFTEETPLAPSSPYSASKTAADLLVNAYHHSFDFPAIITRCSNNYGPYQFPEKLIPLFISNAAADLKLPVYGTGTNVRDWIHVEDHCRGIDAALRRGSIGEVYNFGGGNERTNLEITHGILKLLNKPESLIHYVTDRPGHDLRYAIDSSKAERELQWQPQVNFEQGLQDTINWYLSQAEWTSHIKSGEYQTYYEEQYGKRLE
ncbi:dTDP-glucose 4,6-dehydratase [Symmachiella macrocystis]|uniref:dTDP-glucose 4,6-dehydratase n=1 Tax=Symmachiella macrocystis TaxID=2527985 RepID=A0A5C6BRN9_9PLAN|nr:dTDP-glucose 4,6-dehydratase [Symmachiella macrocystis]TWU14081.1 dTDP-glucose 4,6-dehydratase [Symmachiella macrocystis]